MLARGQEVGDGHGRRQRRAHQRRGGRIRWRQGVRTWKRSRIFFLSYLLISTYLICIR
jgi:hypothetical protein